MRYTPEQLREWYPRLHHMPDPGCSMCGGDGVKAKPLPSDLEMTLRSGAPGFPCICLFVDHDMALDIAESLRLTIRKLRSELCEDEDIPR